MKERVEAVIMLLILNTLLFRCCDIGLCVIYSIEVISMAVRVGSGGSRRGVQEGRLNTPPRSRF